MALFNFDLTGVTSARKEAEIARKEEYEQRREYYKALAEKHTFERLDAARLAEGRYTPQEIANMDLQSSESSKNFAQAEDFRSQARSRVPYDDPLAQDKLRAETSLTLAKARKDQSAAALEEEELINSRNYGNSVKNYISSIQNFGEQIGQTEAELASMRMARKQNLTDMTLIAAEAGLIKKLEGLNTAKAVMDKTFLVESMQLGKEGALSAFAQMSGIDPKTIRSGSKRDGEANTFKYKAKRVDPLNSEAYEEIEADLPAENLAQMSQMLPYGSGVKNFYSPDYAENLLPQQQMNPEAKKMFPQFSPAATGNEPIASQQLFGNSPQTNAPVKPKFFFDPQTGKLMQR